MRLVRVESGDREVLRATHRKYWPPKPNPARGGVDFIAPPPKPTILPGPEGIIFGWGTNRNGHRALMVQFGMSCPFLPESLSFMWRKQAQWNPNFNLWQIPVRSQTVKAAILESFAVAQEALLGMEWGWQIEVLVRWELTDRENAAFQKFIKAMNRFWDSGESVLVQEQSVPVLTMPQEELKEKALQHVRTRLKVPGFDALKPRHCVNYLRHYCTAYEARLKVMPDFSEEAVATQHKRKVFRECNTAIAHAYPWLEKEAIAQIQKRCKRD